MKLNRKQKTIRNFLLAGVLLFTWWVLMGLPSFTQQQALRWAAQQRGLKEEPQVLYRADLGNERWNVIFTADGKVGRAAAVKGTFFSWASIQSLEPCGHAVFFARQDTTRDTADIFVYTEIPGAVTAECDLHVYPVINNGLWEDTYHMTAASKNGVFWFQPERTGWVSEGTMFWDLCNAIENGNGDWDSRYTVSLTFRDSGGNIIETYEQTFERS